MRCFCYGLLRWNDGLMDGGLGLLERGGLIGESGDFAIWVYSSLSSLLESLGRHGRVDISCSVQMNGVVYRGCSQ